MHEALLKRVRSALAVAVLNGDEHMTALLDEVAIALRTFSGAPSMEAIQAAMPRGLAEGPGDRLADTLRPTLKHAAGAVSTVERSTFWHDLINGLLGFAEADMDEQRAAEIAWSLALSYCDALPSRPLNWRAPSAQGGGGPEAVEPQNNGKPLRWILTPRYAPWGEGAAEPVEASGLTAEGLNAGCAGVTLFHTTGSAEFLGKPNSERRFFVVEVDSSGLTAEGNEAGACNTTPVDMHESAKNSQPGAAP